MQQSKEKSLYLYSDVKQVEEGSNLAQLYAGTRI